MVSRCGSISKCNKISVNVSKRNNNWYKISILVDGMTTTCTAGTEHGVDHR
jgi:hypothetical protein